MKRIYLLLTLCCALTACKQNKVEFTFSPTEPKAGESVKFTNNSTSGEEWEWTFGDGLTSTIKAPSHVFKQPGKYIVTLKVDKKKAWMASKEITVYDTIPTFVCDDDSVFHIYKDYTFTANVYNPYNYEVKFCWYLPVSNALLLPYAEITDTTMTNSTLHLYFTRPVEDAGLGLEVILNGDTTYIQKYFDVYDRATNSVLIRTPEYDLRQRIFGSRAEGAFVDFTASPLLDEEQDTLQTYNGYTFRLSELADIFEGIEGFHIASRKIYYRWDGLWVANIDGANPVQIDSLECLAMTLDTKDSRIYWANENGVWYMPFVGSDNNKFVTTPVQLNKITDVSRLAADNESRYLYD